jgi:hypothetical protein
MPLEGAPIEEILKSIECAMPVALIATSPVKTCRPSDRVDVVLRADEFADFDHIPVRDEKGNIIRVLGRKEKARRDAMVAEEMDELREPMLISASASLLSFVEEADHREYSLVLDAHCISGIVTRSDLQKLAVRPALFLRITCLELLLAQWMRERSGTEARWLGTLSPGRQAKINKKWKGMQRHNLAIDKISTTDLEDKVLAVIRLEGFADREKAKPRLEEVVKLRHSVAHAGDFALNPKNANLVARAARSAKELINELRTALKRERTSTGPFQIESP